MAKPSRPREVQRPISHGPRISDAEYDRRVVALNKTMSALPTKDEDRQRRRQELDITIDYRLGIHFPSDRREALWRVQERIERRRLLLSFWMLLPRGIRWARPIGAYVIKTYADALSPEELSQFFGDDLDN